MAANTTVFEPALTVRFVGPMITSKLATAPKLGVKLDSEPAGSLATKM